MSEPVAWLNGSQVPFSELAVPAWDLGVVAGAAVSEMARTYRHRPFRLEQHVARLVETCRELGFAQEFPAELLCHAAEDLAGTNAAAISQDDDLGIVWFATAGANRTYLGERPLPPGTVGIHTFPLPFELWRNSAVEGVRLQVPDNPRAPVASLPLHRKVRNRLHWWLADREAGALEAGARALLKDHEGRITETSTSAFYAVIDDTICTPAHNVLESMSGRLVTEAAAACGLKLRRQDIHERDIPGMAQAFVSSTPSGLLPVYSINGRPLNTCTVIEPLLDWWKSETGLNPRDQIIGSSARESEIRS